MNRKLILFSIVLLAGAFLLGSCVSYPAPNSENESILLFPMGIEKDPDAEIFGRFRFVLQREGTDVSRTIYFKPGSDYQTLRGLTAGRYTLVESAFQYDSGDIGHSADINYKVDLEPGSITILPWTLTYMAWFEKSKNTFYMSNRWERLTTEKAAEILTKLQRQEAFEFWKLSKPTEELPAVIQAKKNLNL